MEYWISFWKEVLSLARDLFKGIQFLLAAPLSYAHSAPAKSLRSLRSQIHQDVLATQGEGRKVEAASGFEPLHRGFADLSLNRLGTPPFPYLYHGCLYTFNLGFRKIDKDSGRK